MTIGERLTRARGNMDIRTASSMGGITTASLIAYESDKRIPRDEVKLRLAILYGTTIEALFF